MVVAIAWGGIAMSMTSIMSAPVVSAVSFQSQHSLRTSSGETRFSIGTFTRAATSASAERAASSRAAASGLRLLHRAAGGGPFCGSAVSGGSGLVRAASSAASHTLALRRCLCPPKIGSAAQAKRHGIAYVPEDRGSQGIVRPMSLRHNVSMAVLERIVRHGFIDRATEAVMATDAIDRFGISAPGNTVFKELGITAERVRQLQNAALGRAVIGGLAGATIATLFLVPVVYSLMARSSGLRPVEPELAEPSESHS